MSGVLFFLSNWCQEQVYLHRKTEIIGMEIQMLCIGIINIFRSPCWEEFNKLKPKFISCKFLPQTAGAGSQLLMLQTSGYCLSGIFSAAGWFHFGSHILFCIVSTRLVLCQANAHLWRPESVCVSFWDSAACPCQLKQQQQQQLINMHFMFRSHQNLRQVQKQAVINSYKHFLKYKLGERVISVALLSKHSLPG